MADKSIGFVGAGNMAEAMIRGLLRGDVFKPKQITASAPREERQRELTEKYGIRATPDNSEAARQSIVVLSVKPQSAALLYAIAGWSVRRAESP